MKVFDTLRNRSAIPQPPARGETYANLQRPAAPAPPRVRTGRTEQFNVRVKAGFKKRVDELARLQKETLGGMLEAMLAAYESGAAPGPNAPTAEASAGRTRPVRLWANEAVYNALGQIARERKLTVSALLEDMLAHEVERLDPHGGKFGVDVRK